MLYTHTYMKEWHHRFPEELFQNSTSNPQLPEKEWHATVALHSNSKHSTALSNEVAIQARMVAWHSCLFPLSVIQAPKWEGRKHGPTSDITSVGQSIAARRITDIKQPHGTFRNIFICLVYLLFFFLQSAS